MATLLNPSLAADQDFYGPGQFSSDGEYLLFNIGLQGIPGRVAYYSLHLETNTAL